MTAGTNDRANAAGPRLVRKGLAIAAGATFLLVVSNGCRPPMHHPPKPGQPAATVKFRIGHQYRPRAFFLPYERPIQVIRLSSRLTIDGKTLPYQPRLGRVATTWTKVKPRTDLGLAS